MLDYIKQQSSQGVDKVKIKESLLGAGWKESDVSESFRILFPETTVTPENNISNNESMVPQAGLLGTKQILSNALEDYKKHFFKYVGVYLLPVILIQLYSMFVIDKIFGVDYAVAESVNPLMFLLIIPVFILLTWGHSSLISVVVDRKEGGGIAQYFSTGFSKLPSLLWVHILTLTILFGLYMLFVIPGIIFSFYLAFSAFFIFDQDIKGTNALKASRSYVQGNWGKVATRVFLISIAIFLMGVFLEMILSLVGLESIASFVSSTILFPLFVIANYVLYKNLRNIKGLVNENDLKQTGGLKGFLIWGIIAVILVTFSVIALSAMKGARDRGEETKSIFYDIQRSSDISTIKLALDRYYLEYGFYPYMLTELNPVFLTREFNDPVTGMGYVYERISDDEYSICSELSSGEKYCMTEQMSNL